MDFWTFCCANCLHVLDELRPFEQKFADQLTIIGVHSPKFEHEADAHAVVAAVERYDVRHPVLDDPELITWKQYAARAWPTLVLIDPEGYIVAQLSGEGHAHALDALLTELVADHTRRGTLHVGDGPYVPRLPSHQCCAFRPRRYGWLTVSSWWLTRAITRSPILPTMPRPSCAVSEVVSAVLSTARPDVAQFSEPNGLCQLPREVAGWVGYDVVIADTVNHALRGVRLSDGHVTTVAGTGQQWMQGDEVPYDSDPRTPLSSPWDVAWYPAWHEVAVAMAGIHQLWSFDPVTPSLSVRAGTSNEGLVDGEERNAWFAQTSGLDVDGETLWLVDSETSSLRRCATASCTPRWAPVSSTSGSSTATRQRQCCSIHSGCSCFRTARCSIADTYNGAVRRFDPATQTVSTLVRDLAEPSGLVLDGDSVVVVESAAHRLTRVPLASELLQVSGDRLHTQRPVTRVRPDP